MKTCLHELIKQAAQLAYNNPGKCIATKLILTMLAMSPGSTLAAKEHLCFEGISDKSNILCFPHAEDPERDKILRQAIERLGMAIDRGEPLESLAVMAPDMAEYYPQDKFETSLQKHFPQLDHDSIEYIVHHADLSTALLTDGAQLLFDHGKRLFVFSFDEPAALAGLAYYYGHGAKSGILMGDLPASNCSLSRDGITLVAPSRGHLLYSQTGSFCTYDGYYFKLIKDKAEVRRVDQIGQGHSLVSTNGFSSFLKWLRQGQE